MPDSNAGQTLKGCTTAFKVVDFQKYYDYKSNNKSRRMYTLMPSRKTHTSPTYLLTYLEFQSPPPPTIASCCNSILTLILQSFITHCSCQLQLRVRTGRVGRQHPQKYAKKFNFNNSKQTTAPKTNTTKNKPNNLHSLPL